MFAAGCKYGRTIESRGQQAEVVFLRVILMATDDLISFFFFEKNTEGNGHRKFIRYLKLHGVILESD